MMIEKLKRLKRLKSECHYYFDKYVESTLDFKSSKKHYQNKRRIAYHKLAQELHTDAFKCHFSNMNNIEELEKALRVIKKW